MSETEADDISRAEMDTRIASGEPIEHAVTKVYRFGFANEADFNEWLHYARTVSKQKLS
jgi:hypothetical protein